MQSENRVMLVGNLGADVELKQAGEMALAKLVVATSDQWKNKDGEMQTKTEWHRVVVWGKTAEVLAPYLLKGRAVYVTGKVTYREYEKTPGDKRYMTEIKADRVILLGHKANEEAQAGLQPVAKTRTANKKPMDFGDVPF
jgi:single-strand DNA-binding protein